MTDGNQNQSVLVVGANAQEIAKGGAIESLLNEIKAKFPSCKTNVIREADEIRDKNADYNDVTVIYASYMMSDRSWDYLFNDILSFFPKLKLFHVRSTGVDHIARHQNLHKLQDQIIFSNGKGCYIQALGEWVVYAITHFAKSQYRLPLQRSTKDYNQFNVGTLHKKKLGMLGYGSIGKKCAQIMKDAFQVHVTAIKTSDSPAEGADEVLVATEDNICKAFATLDFIVCTLPNTEKTRQIINKKVMDAAHKELIFVNIGRGSNVDQAYLVDKLMGGSIKGAALDVFEKEPVPKDDKIWEVPDSKLLLSPHCADWTFDIETRGNMRFLETLTQLVLNNSENISRIDLKKGY